MAHFVRPVKLPQCDGIVLQPRRQYYLLTVTHIGFLTRKVRGASPQSTIFAQSKNTFSPKKISAAVVHSDSQHPTQRLSAPVKSGRHGRPCCGVQSWGEPVQTVDRKPECGHSPVAISQANSGKILRDPRRIPPGPNRAPGRAVTP